MIALSGVIVQRFVLRRSVPRQKEGQIGQIAKAPGGYGSPLYPWQSQYASLDSKCQ